LKNNNKYDIDALLRAALKNEGLQRPQTVAAPPDRTGKLSITEILKNIGRPLSTGLAVAVTLAFVFGIGFAVRYLNTLAPENFAGEANTETTRAFEVIKVDDDGFIYVTEETTEETTENPAIEETENTQKITETTEETVSDNGLAEVGFGYSLYGDTISGVRTLTYAEITAVKFIFSGINDEFNISDLTDLSLTIDGEERVFSLDNAEKQLRNEEDTHGDIYVSFINDGDGEEHRYGTDKYGNGIFHKGVVLDSQNPQGTYLLTGNYRGKPFAAQGYIADAFYQLYYHGTNIDEIDELYGWLNVMGTRVSYPVVQCEDNEFYLNHSHDKNRNPAGAVFADYRNSKNIMQNRNTIIYGHNMLNGAMFAGLTEFGRDEELFRKGMIEIEITSENAIYCYEVFSVREEEITGESLINENDMVINFDSDEEYAGYLREMQRRSIFQKDIELGADSKIITLATWVNDVSTRKMFIVQGVFAGVKIP